MAEQNLVGLVGSVVRAVRGGKLPGEIRILDAGEPSYYLAYCERELPVATRVRIVHDRGWRQVDVEPCY